MESDDFIDDLSDGDLMLALEAVSAPNPAATATAPVTAAASSSFSSRGHTSSTRSNSTLDSTAIHKNSGRKSAPSQPKTLARGSVQTRIQPPQKPPTRQVWAADPAAELADLPSDAFDSSFSSLAPAVGQSQRSLIASVRQPMRIATQGGGSFRQTTLFGGTIEEDQLAQPPSSNRVYRGDLPPEKPTHHKLDQEALKTWVYPTNLGPVRDYQFNIVKNGLFNNTLVALPTGLGKTFIAATVMLNFYRWTKEAKLLFLAPTKPLVSQQVEACLNIAGIPRSESTLLTGDTPPALRVAEWANKRVFFMTPQTLENDFSKGYADPKSVALLVIDEAHRSTGDYAYVKVITFMRRFTKSFRVLALTATPGSTVEGVQDVIDNLGVSQVEIRTEESIDIRQYVHARGLERYTLDPSVEMRFVQEHFSKALRPFCEKLDQQHIWYGRDPMSLTNFGLQKARQDWLNGAGRHANQGTKFMISAVISVLQGVAHSIKLLNYHGIKPFYDNVAEFRRATEESEKASKYRSQLVRNPDFQEMMNTIEGWLKQDSFESHPKIGFLRDQLNEHFQGKPPGSNTRAIVFSEFRDSAEEIVRTLNRSGTNNMKASIFVGQADSKRSAGMKQKQQIQTIENFKTGAFNVLVATSIGEEGLDIGQVDLIICYDASASPIRMLQRMGRTGRKRSGHVSVLLMKGKEEDKFAEAQENYSQMQKLICDGSRFNFRFDLSERILPRDVKPEVDCRFVEIPVENTQDPSLPEPKKTGARLKNTFKKKFNMPDDVETGFVTAGSVLNGGQGTRFKTAAKKLPPPPPAETDFLAEVPDLTTALESVQTEKVGFVRAKGANWPFNSSVGGGRESFVDIDTAHPTFLQTLRPEFYLKHGAYTRRNVRLLSRLAKGAYTRPRDRCDAYLHIRVPKLTASSDAEGGEDDIEEEEADTRQAGTRRTAVESTAAEPPLAKRRRVSGGVGFTAPLAKTKAAAFPFTPKRTERERLVAQAFGDTSDDNDDDDKEDTKSRRFKPKIKGMTRQRSSQFQSYSSYTFSGGRGESSVKHEEPSSPALEAEPRSNVKPTPSTTLLKQAPRREPARKNTTPLLKTTPAVVASGGSTTSKAAATAATASKAAPPPQLRLPACGFLEDDEDEKEDEDDEVMVEEGGIVDMEEEGKQKERLGGLEEDFDDVFEDEPLSLPDMAPHRSIKNLVEEDTVEDMVEDTMEDTAQEERRPPEDDDKVEVIRFSQPARHARGSLRKRACRGVGGRGRGRGRAAGAMAANGQGGEDIIADEEGTTGRGGGRGRGRGRGRARGRGGASRAASYGGGGRLEDRGDDCTRTSDNYETDGSDSGGDLLSFIVDDDEDENGGGGMGDTSSLGFIDEDEEEEEERRARGNRRDGRGSGTADKQAGGGRDKNMHRSEVVLESSPMPSSPPIRAAAGKAPENEEDPDTGSSSFYVPMQLDSDEAEDRGRLPNVFRQKPGRGNQQKPAATKGGRVTRAGAPPQQKRPFAPPPAPRHEIEDIDDSDSDDVFARAPPRGRRRVFDSDSP